MDTEEAPEVPTPLVVSACFPHWGFLNSHWLRLKTEQPRQTEMCLLQSAATAAAAAIRMSIENIFLLNVNTLYIYNSPFWRATRTLSNMPTTEMMKNHWWNLRQWASKIRQRHVWQRVIKSRRCAKNRWHEGTSCHFFLLLLSNDWIRIVWLCSS